MNSAVLENDVKIRKLIYVMLIKSGYYQKDDFPDLYQDVFEYLIRKEDRIKKNWLEKASFSTFLSKIVFNKCLELQKKKIAERKRSATLNYYDPQDIARVFENVRHYELSQESRLILHYACRRLRFILETYGQEQQKLTFSLKAFYRIVLQIMDLNGYPLDDIQKEQIGVWIKNLNNMAEEGTKEEIKMLLTNIFNMLEDSDNSIDAIRKWTWDRVDQMVVILNRPPFRSAFSRETFQFLFMCCFDEPSGH